MPILSSSETHIWDMLKPLSVKGFLMASQQLVKSEYDDLKKGFLDFFSAPNRTL